MGSSHVTSLWREPEIVSCYKAAVSLHSHTLHSREMLDFIPRISRSIPGLSAAIRNASNTHEIVWENAWWTPPLGPQQAWQLEAGQITRVLNLTPLVSITDHDNIDGPAHLRVLPGLSEFPLSVEWTIPWRGTVFHIGVHNMATAQMWDSTNGAPEEQVPALLAALHSCPETLIVFNHPFWDEKGADQQVHNAAVLDFMRRCGDCIHALELNGLRPWLENQRAVALAQATGKPVISGGDRHGREANACLNLTNAKSFSEFVAEVRDGHSQVLFLPQYKENRVCRLTHQVWDVLRHDSAHGLGWQAWNDRIFYQCKDGQIRSLRELWGEGEPLIIRLFVKAVDLMSHAPFRSVLRAAFPSEEVA